MYWALARVQELMPLYCVCDINFPVISRVAGDVFSLALPLSVPSLVPAVFPNSWRSGSDMRSFPFSPLAPVSVFPFVSPTFSFPIFSRSPPQWPRSLFPVKISTPGLLTPTPGLLTPLSPSTLAPSAFFPPIPLRFPYVLSCPLCLSRLSVSSW